MVKTHAQKHLTKLKAKTERCCKRKIANSWDKLEGAQDVFIDILSRLSLKSIRRFKTVSKYWYSSVSNKYFAKKQITQSRKNPSFIACPVMNYSMKLYTMEAESLKLSYLNTLYPSEKSHAESMYMISSFNGLICCVNQTCHEDVESKFCDLQIWICNPCTGETLLLPQGRPSFKCQASVGVAYGSDFSEYRVFRIFCTGKKFPEERLHVEGYYFIEGEMFSTYSYALAYECEVYSSSTGSWKNIGPVPCVPMLSSLMPYRSSHVFVGGKIYWLVSLNEPGEILSVDWEGRFEVINLPHYYENQHSDAKITDGTYLFNLQGSLALLVLHPDYMDIWIWKVVRGKYSWVLEFQDRIPWGDCDIVLGVTSLKNQMLCFTERHWRVYDVNTGRWKKVRGPRTGFGYPAVFPFTESVLPCNGRVSL